MKLGVKVKEKIARIIADKFTTNEIVNVFTDANIPTNRELYAKWRITLDAFSKIETEEGLFHILEEFCHPLNFSEPFFRDTFIENLNNVLTYEDLTIKSDERTAEIIPIVKKTTIKNTENSYEVLPDINKSSYSEKVISLIAEEFCNILGNFEIRKIIRPIIEKNEILYNQRMIKGYLVDEIFEENPFDTFDDALQTIRKKDKDADKTISSIITRLLHPLNYHADEEKSDGLSDKINQYLKYDNLNIRKKGKEYIILSDTEISDEKKAYEEMVDDISTAPQEIVDEMKAKFDNDLLTDIKEIETLLDTHQSFMDVVELFCQDTKKPTRDLNNAYLFLAQKIQEDIKKLKLQAHEINLYKPFKDLYSAEIEWNGNGDIMELRLGPKLSWDAIRPSLHNVHSKITQLNIDIKNSNKDNKNKTDDEKHLEQIKALISDKRTVKTVQKTDKVKKVEILHKYEDKKTPRKSLRNSVIRFDDTIPAIFIDEIEIPLPEYGKEYYFCRAMWKRKSNEAVDWSKIYNDMEGKTPDFLPDKELWRYVYDAKNDVNKRVKDVSGTTESLFDWKDKTTKRLY